MKKLICWLLILAVMTASVACVPKPETAAVAPAAQPAAQPETQQEAAVAEPKELINLRVGIMPYLNSIPVVYAKQQGWDTELGVNLETVLFTSGAPLNESIGADLIDVGAMSGAAVTAVAAYGCKLIGEVGNASNGIEIFVRPDSPIAKVVGSNPTYPTVCGDAETVKGAQILVEMGTMNQLDVLKWIEKIGLKDTDVELANMTQAQGYQAFLGGTGDVIALGPPLSYQAKEQGWVPVATLEDLGVKLAENIVMNSKTYKKAQTDKDLAYAVAVYLHCIYRANAAFVADPALKKQVLTDWYAENGSTVTEESIDLEVKYRTLYTMDDVVADIDSLGQANLNLAEFNASIGQLEADKLELFPASVAPEFILAAKEVGK